MGRKLTGRKVAGKGLKGALQSHLAANKKKSNPAGKGGVQEPVPKEGKKEAESEAKPKRKPKPFIPFGKTDTLLLVGEGDFSYAASIVQNGYIEPANLVATGFDSEAQVVEKYPTAAENLQFLKDLDVKVIHNVDATNLVTSLKASKKRVFPAKLNHVMFNFPHTGRGMKDTIRNIRDHQKLVGEYFKSSRDLLQTVNSKLMDRSGYFEKNATESILLTVFEGEPYTSWGIKALARNIEFKVERSGAFEWDAYPGYSHRRTDGTGNTTKKASERSARTYVFTKFVPKDLEEKKVQDSDSD